MHRTKRIALAIGLLTAWGCTPKVGATHDPLVVFPAEATWAWDDAANLLPRDEGLRALNLDAMIRELAAEAFAARGYVEASGGTPPRYRLSYRVSVGRVIEQDGARATGSVSLELVEADTDRRVWTGFVRTGVDLSRSEEERRSRLRSDMRKMLRGFPPGR